MDDSNCSPCGHMCRTHAGAENLSAVDILSTGRLVNYFGKVCAWGCAWCAAVLLRLCECASGVCARVGAGSWNMI